METIKNSTLYVVSTPIGNLEDITLRALNILKNVEIIACEDTRHSLKLLNHYEIKKHLISYHSYNEKNSASGIIKLLSEGKSLALISDGGTPCISDPGYILVKECLEAGFEVVSIPGASSFLALLTSSGFRTDSFYFHGFLSPKEGRKKKELLKMKELETTHIIFESPYRLLKTLDAIGEILPDCRICVGKELTKINEKVITGNFDGIKKALQNEKIVGEFIILIANA